MKYPAVLLTLLITSYSAAETNSFNLQNSSFDTRHFSNAGTLSEANPRLDIQFESSNSTLLLKQGDLSVSRKIMLNAAGTEINPTAFQFDLHFELSYKFI